MHRGLTACSIIICLVHSRFQRLVAALESFGVTVPSPRQLLVRSRLLDRHRAHTGHVLNGTCSLQSMGYQGSQWSYSSTTERAWGLHLEDLLL